MLWDTTGIFFRIFMSFYEGELELIVDNSEHSTERVVEHVFERTQDTVS